MLKISFLGGVGEFGKNLTVYDQDGKILIVDAGSMFPENIPGIDLVIPDFTFLEGRAEDICGIALTHGHEDHIGAVPFLLEKFPAAVWGTRFTLGLLRKKMSEVAANSLGETEMIAGKRYTVGPFQVEAVPVTHSIPDAASLVIRTKDGIFLHSGDFKFDQSPLDGRLTHYKRYQEVGEEGVTAVLMDSTNSGVEGMSGSERRVIDSLDRYFAKQEGKLIIA